MKLDAARASATYVRYLDRVAAGRAGYYIGFLGDQTLYTFMGREVAWPLAQHAERANNTPRFDRTHRPRISCTTSGVSGTGRSPSTLDSTTPPCTNVLVPAASCMPTCNRSSALRG